MKKIYYPLACCLIGGMLASCGGGAKKSNATEEAAAPTTTAVSYSKSLKAPETDSLNLPIDADGYITIFDGKSLDGWRGYGKDKVPSRWIIEDGCLKFCGTGTGEGQTGEGGDLIFAHKFKNFELELEWKISKGGNSGIFYLAQEVTSKDKVKNFNGSIDIVWSNDGTEDDIGKGDTAKFIFTATTTTGKIHRLSGNASGSKYGR